jgi:enoyl-CoA hydratase
MAVTVTEKEGIAQIAFEFASANAMGEEFLTEFMRALDETADARALVLLGRGKAFSVGLDLPVLVTLDERAVRRFITLFAQLMERLFALPIPTVAAINGHAVAGGFVLASTADFRLAASGPAKIGMTGVALGISYPSLVVSMLQYTLPQTSWHSVLLEGRLFDVEAAEAMGLIHGVCAPEQLEELAHTRARILAHGDPTAYARTKHMLKRTTLQAAAAGGEESREAFVKALFSQATRARLLAAAERLAQNKS